MVGFQRRANRTYILKLHRRYRQLLADRRKLHAQVEALDQRVTQVEAVVILLGKMVPMPAQVEVSPIPVSTSSPSSDTSTTSAAGRKAKAV
eukprot:4021774-Prorocentrum_lima.AAC.1